MKLDISEYRALMQKQGNKYRNIPKVYNGISYQSTKEADRARDLDFMAKGNLVKDIKPQVKFDLMCNGKKIGFYKADFTYIDLETGEKIIEDVKGMRTAVFNLKKKILESMGYKIKIV